MKRIFLILSITLSLISVEVKGQWGVYAGCVNINGISGQDTTIYFRVFLEDKSRLIGPWSIDIDDEAITSDSLDADIGMASRVGQYKSLVSDIFPYDLGSDSTLVNGSYNHGRTGYGDVCPFRYLGLRLFKEAAGVQTVATDSVCYRVLMFE
jgi:hypothetical protein